MDFLDKCFYIRFMIFLLNVPVVYYILSVVSYFMIKKFRSLDKFEKQILDIESKITKSFTWLGSCIILMIGQLILFYMIKSNGYYVTVSDNMKSVIDLVIVTLVLAFFIPLNFIICNGGYSLDWSSIKKYKTNKWIISYSSCGLYLLVLLILAFK